jgi:hypothetical protein
MGLFDGFKTPAANKNSINSDEYERLVKRIIDVDARMRLRDAEYKLLETDVANLRGKFNQKLKGIKETDAKDEMQQKKETETINNSEYVPFG